ncbi:MAG: DUF4112 domain-containing protein [Pseudomonadota bacterium]|nr:MAG: DUF4112 domain-containing protein [Pseudomonadota bacterium]
MATALETRSQRDAPTAILVQIPPWAEALARLLDSAFVIPGVRVRVGLDALLGLIAPGAGDAASGIASAALLVLAFRMRVPKVILLRMLVNITIDAVLGSIPVLGDLFDVVFRAAHENLSLLRRHAHSATGRPTASDYVVVAIALLVVGALLLLPVLVGVLLIHFATVLTGG